MAELKGLSVKVPIKFSEKAQRKLYETCMAYKELAEVRGAENTKLREQVMQLQLDWESERDYADQMAAKEKKAVDENDKLREICASLFRLANNECLSGKRHCDDCPMSRNESPCVLSLDFIAMLGLGIDVTPWDVERIEVE